MRDASHGDRTRGHIVAAATRLFYGEGIRAVSMDAVAEKAGVTKKTLYYHFTSKDELVAATIQPGISRRWSSICVGSPKPTARWRTRSAGCSQNFGTSWIRRAGGVRIPRTIAELANTPGHPAVKAGAAHKNAFRSVAEKRQNCVTKAFMVPRPSRGRS